MISEDVSFHTKSENVQVGPSVRASSKYTPKGNSQKPVIIYQITVSLEFFNRISLLVVTG